MTSNGRLAYYRSMHETLTPGLNYKLAPHSRHTDAFVIAIVLRNLKGTSQIALAAEFDLDEVLVRRWCNGENRVRCWNEARRQYEQWLKCDA